MYDVCVCDVCVSACLSCVCIRCICVKRMWYMCVWYVPIFFWNFCSMKIFHKNSLNSFHRLFRCTFLLISHWKLSIHLNTIKIGWVLVQLAKHLFNVALDLPDRLQELSSCKYRLQHFFSYLHFLKWVINIAFRNISILLPPRFFSPLLFLLNQSFLILCFFCHSYHLLFSFSVLPLIQLIYQFMLSISIRKMTKYLIAKSLL